MKISDRQPKISDRLKISDFFNSLGVLQHPQAPPAIRLWSPPTNQHQHPVFSSCHPTNSVKALDGKISHSMDLLTPSSPGGQLKL